MFGALPSVPVSTSDLMRQGAVAWTAFLGALAFAYRKLFFFDPNLHAPSEVEPLEEWFFSSAGESPLLVLALTAWLIVRRIPRLTANCTEGWSTLLGYAGSVLAMGMVIWGYYTAAYQILAPSLAILLIWSGVALGGLSGGRTMLMPAAFAALLATPIPTPLLNSVIYPMQIWTAETVVEIVRFLGFAVRQSGDLILTPWATFQVIETCAGLRAVQTLVMTAFIYGELVEHRSARRVILILLAPLVGLTVNVSRVLVLVFNPIPEAQPEHALQGIVMLVAGVFLLWGLDEALDRCAIRGVATEEASLGSPVSGPSSFRRLWLLTALLAVTGLVSTLIDPWRPSGLADSNVHSIPREVGDWRMDPNLLPVDEEYLASVRFSSRTWRLYTRADESVTFFAGTDDRLRRVTSVVSGKTRTLQSGSFVLDEPVAVRSTGKWDLSEVRVETKGGRIWLVHHGYGQIKGIWMETIRSALALDRGPWRRAAPSLVIRLATQIDPTPSGRLEARRRLADFEKQLVSRIDQLDPKPWNQASLSTTDPRRSPYSRIGSPGRSSP